MRWELKNTFNENLRDVIRFAKTRNMEIECMFTPDMTKDHIPDIAHEEQRYGVRCYNSRAFSHPTSPTKL